MTPFVEVRLDTSVEQIIVIQKDENKSKGIYLIISEADESSKYRVYLTEEEVAVLIKLVKYMQEL
jgi:hypothetical protein